MMVDWGSLFLRVSFPLTMIVAHGWGKMMMLFADGPIQFADPIGVGQTTSLVLAVLGEVVCPFLMLIGLRTRWVAIPAIITMAVAAFIIHGSDPFAKKEMALIYLFGFIGIFLVGSGKFSLDKMLSKN